MVLVNRERGAKTAKAPVYRISGARKGLTEDVRGRQRRYVLSMSVRTVCFILAVVFTGPVRWTMLAAALLLPYIAVVVANAGREPTSDPPQSQIVPPQAHRAIEPPPEAVLTSTERNDIRVMPDDAWIVPEDAGPEDERSKEERPEDAGSEAGGSDAPPDTSAGETVADAGKTPPGEPDDPPEGNRQ